MDEERNAPPRRRAVREAIGQALITVVVFAVLAMTATWWFQRSLMYPGVGDHVPAAPGWTETTTDVPGVGATSTYELPARPGMPTILFLHGNATGYRGSIAATRGFAEAGYGVVVPEWHGYAGNPGRVTQKSLEALALASMRRLETKGLRARDVVIYGNSVGTGPAIVAASRPHGRLLIVSGVASMTEVARSHYFFAHPLLIADPWPNARRLASIGGPVDIVHATDDRVVPFAQGLKLAKAAGTTVTRTTGGHGIAFDVELQRTLARRLAPDGT